MVIVQCNRCGCSNYPSNSGFKTSLEIFSDGFLKEAPSIREGYHLCEKCLKALYDFLGPLSREAQKR